MEDEVKETAKLRPTTNERNSGWVTFPNGKEYLLPIVARDQTLVPEFHEDGSVGMEIIPGDKEVALLVTKMLELAATVDNGEIWIRTKETYLEFFQLMRRLLLTNYEYTEPEIAGLLTLNNVQISAAFEAILKHILGQ
jgi:hypothetical protein